MALSLLDLNKNRSHYAPIEIPIGKKWLLYPGPTKNFVKRFVSVAGSLVGRRGLDSAPTALSPISCRSDYTDIFILCKYLIQRGILSFSNHEAQKRISMDKQEEYLKLFDAFHEADAVYMKLINEVVATYWEGIEDPPPVKPLTAERMQKIQEAEQAKKEAKAKLDNFQW